MTSKGIGILDQINNVLSVYLKDILEEVKDGSSFSWSLLFLDGQGHLGEGKSIPIFTDEINSSKNGLLLSWSELNSLSQKMDQIFEILVIGNSDRRYLHRYKNDKEMYESCDFVIEMIHCNFWEVFSKNAAFIERLSLKFKKIKLLDSSFLNKI